MKNGQQLLGLNASIIRSFWTSIW